MAVSFVRSSVLVSTNVPLCVCVCVCVCAFSIVDALDTKVIGNTGGTVVGIIVLILVLLVVALALTLVMGYLYKRQRERRRLAFSSQVGYNVR